MKQANIRSRKNKSKKHKKNSFHTAVFVKVITEILKNICKIVKSFF